jgi:hypothetical protein
VTTIRFTAVTVMYVQCWERYHQLSTRSSGPNDETLRGGGEYSYAPIRRACTFCRVDLRDYVVVTASVGSSSRTRTCYPLLGVAAGYRIECELDLVVLHLSICRDHRHLDEIELDLVGARTRKERERERVWGSASNLRSMQSLLTSVSQSRYGFHLRVKS